MARVTLSEDSIDSLEVYFNQLEIARPLLNYEMAAQKAIFAIESWEQNWKYLVQQHEHEEPERLSEYMLDVGFYVIYTQSIIEYLVDLKLAQSLNINQNYILNSDNEVSMSSISLNNKLSLLDLTDSTFREDISNSVSMRNKFAHDVALSNYFYENTGSGELVDDIQQMYENVNSYCKEIYDMNISQVAETVLDGQRLGKQTNLDECSAASLVLEIVERPDGIGTQNTDTLAQYEIEVLEDELSSRGFSPDDYDLADLIPRPYVEQDRPVRNNCGVVIQSIKSPKGLSTAIESELHVDVVTYDDLENDQYPFRCDISAEVENTTIVTESTDDFTEYIYQNWTDFKLDIQTDRLPNKPWVDVDVTARAVTNNYHYVDHWHNQLPNIDWVSQKRSTAVNHLSTVWLALETHSDFDIDSYGEEDKISEILTDDDELDEILPLVESELNMARSLLIRANDPINALNPEDIPPAIAVVPTEDAGRVNVLEAQLDVIEYINSELEEEIHQFMFDGVGKDEN